MLMFWFHFLNLNTFINLMIWSGDNYDEVWDGKIWCDITTRLEAASSSGKIAAISAMSLNLYMILCAKSPTFIRPGSRKKLIIDLSICLITPIFIMCTNYIILANRYDIFRYQGCTQAYVASGVTIGLYSIWNIVWCVVAVIFATLTLYEYFQKRKDVIDLLRCTNSGLNIKRFARLLIFSLLVILAMTPLAIYYFIGDLRVYRGKFNWKEVHNEMWGEILYADFGFYLLYDKFVNIGLSFITFFLFGLGSDSISTYKSILSKFGIRFPSKNEDQELGTPSADLPYVTRLPTQVKVDSRKSQFSAGSSQLTNNSTMNEFTREISEIVNYNTTPTTQTDTLKSNFTINAVSSAEHDLTGILDYDGDSNEELNRILNATTRDNCEQGISYSYSVTQKPPDL
ncbi:hypothetical protein G9P44_001425 [Scheffersomyces stipitis]|nr:hypothetical protein G9P44_005404 [Scheffersomyces stipitis]KAG2735211.1 hypothetical protein G9P44_001425 [Scheffersomyces stipitis]